MHRFWRRYGLLAAGGAIAGSVLLAGLVSLFWRPADPLRMDIPHRLQPPSAAHWLGTDPFGRDVAARVLAGTAPVLYVSLTATALGATSGVLLGALAGWLGGWPDEALMRLLDTLYAFPVLLMALVVIAALGPGLGHAAMALGIAFIPVFARLARAGVLEAKNREHVVAARAAGAREWWILWRHVLPLAAGPLVVQLSTVCSAAVLAEAGLSYLGLGVPPPDPSWGRMLQESQTFLAVAPWNAVFPGLAIAWTVLGFNLLGDGLRDLLDRRSPR